MKKLIILGTANAIPGENNDNTHMLLMCDTHKVLIDCGSNPTLHLKRYGIFPDDLTDVILTHFHPDHVAGVPQLIMSLWLMGRQKPLTIHGLSYTLERVDGLMNLFNWSKWPGIFTVEYHTLPAEEMKPIISNDEIRIFSSPNRHLIPCIALRIEFSNQRKVLAYSSDTEPCPEVIRLAEQADLLIHEATGEMEGHSSAAQAGEVAFQAGAQELMLIHYPPDGNEEKNLEASSRFHGRVIMAKDLMELEYA